MSPSFFQSEAGRFIAGALVLLGLGLVAQALWLGVAPLALLCLLPLLSSARRCARIIVPMPVHGAPHAWTLPALGLIRQ